MNFDFSWIWPLMMIMIYIMIIAMIVPIIMKVMGLFPKRQDAMQDNDSINRKVWKELQKSAKMNRVDRIKHVYIKPSKYQLPKYLGRYKGHISDPRILILRIKTSKIPFSKHMLLFVPYQLLQKDVAEGFAHPVMMPLTVKNIELYIEGVQKYGYWWIPLVRKDTGIPQEHVEVLVSNWVSTHMAMRYNIQQLPPENMKAPTYAASISPQVEKRIQYNMPSTDKEEEKEVSE